MLIITGTVVTISISSLNTKNLTNLYADLKSLNDKIAVYYNSYGELPVKEKFTGSYNFAIVANPNDDADLYYVIDLNKLENLLLTKKISGTGDDVYIINKKTHTIYYPEGVSLDGEIYYRLPGEYTKIEGTIDKTDIAENAQDYYGDYVINYTTPSGDPNVRWRIFHADDENIYLIADDYIHFDYAPTSENYTLSGSNYTMSFGEVVYGVMKDYDGASNITDTRITKWLSFLKDYPSKNSPSMKAVAFMLDETRWSPQYANPIYAEYAIGGVTLDLFCESYKNTHQNKFIEYTYDSYGYKQKWNTDNLYNDEAYVREVEDNEELYFITNDNKCTYMWIASPASMNNNKLITVNYKRNC